MRASGDALGEYNMTIADNVLTNNRTIIPVPPIFPNSTFGMIDVTIGGQDGFFGNVLVNDENLMDFGLDLVFITHIRLRTIEEAVAQYVVDNNTFVNQAASADAGIVLTTEDDSRTRFILSNNDFEQDEPGDFWTLGAIFAETFDDSELFMTYDTNTVTAIGTPDILIITPLVPAFTTIANDTSRLVTEFFSNTAIEVPGGTSNFNFIVNDQAGMAVELTGNTSPDGFFFTNNGTLIPNDVQMQINNGGNVGQVFEPGAFIDLDTPPPPTPVANFVSPLNFRNIALPYIQIPGLP